MWILWGCSAILLTISTLFIWLLKKEFIWCMTLSFMTFIVSIVQFMKIVAQWVELGDIAALKDVVPAMANYFFALSIFVLVGNGWPLLDRQYKKRKNIKTASTI